MITATQRKDMSSGIAWLEFDGKPDEDCRGLLKSAGWRWSGYRQQWYNNRRYLAIPPIIEITDGGTVEYAAERSERLETASTKHSARSSERFELAGKMADIIPFGQPILVGHHSETRDTNYRGKIDNMMQTAVGEYRTAEWCQDQAQASKQHQKKKGDAGVIARRIERLKAERTNRINQHKQSIQWCQESIRYATNAEERAKHEQSLHNSEQWITHYLQEQDAHIAEQEKLLAAAGGIVTDTLALKTGDIVSTRHGKAEVLKVYKQSVSCKKVKTGEKILIHKTFIYGLAEPSI